MGDPESDLMDSTAVAQFYDVSLRTIQNWTRLGLIPSTKLGHRRLYLRSVLQEHLRERCVAVPADDHQLAEAR